MTSIQYTVSLSALFSGYCGKHQCFYLHVFILTFTFGAFSHFKNYMWSITQKVPQIWDKKLVQKNPESTAARYRKEESRRDGYESGGTLPYSMPLGSLLGHPVTLLTKRHCYLLSFVWLRLIGTAGEVELIPSACVPRHWRCSHAVLHSQGHTRRPQSTQFLSGFMMCRVSVTDSDHFVTTQTILTARTNINIPWHFHLN